MQATDTFEQIDSLNKAAAQARQENHLKWDLRFMELASLVATWSKDPSTQCGAVIVRPDKTITAVGYNGFPRGCKDNKELYENRELKYARVVHAEVNAILACDVRPVGCDMYTFPQGIGPSCDRCTTCIIQAGIKRVVHVLPDPDNNTNFNERWRDAIQRGLDMYKEAGVQVVGIPFHKWRFR